MNGMLLFFGSFFLVFALGFQQSNVQHRRYQAAFVNGLFIGVMNLLVLRIGPSAAIMEMIAFLIGGVRFPRFFVFQEAGFMLPVSLSVE